MTKDFPYLGSHTYHVLERLIGSRGQSRTDTLQGLNLLPLPIGIHGHY